MSPRFSLTSRTLRIPLGVCVAALLMSTSGCATAHLKEFNSVQMGNPAAATSSVKHDRANLPGKVHAYSPITALKMGSDSTILVASTSQGTHKLASLPLGSFTADWSVTAKDKIDDIDLSDSGRAVLLSAGKVQVLTAGTPEIEFEAAGATSLTALSGEGIATATGEGNVSFRGPQGDVLEEIDGISTIDELDEIAGSVVAIDRAETVIADVNPAESFIGPKLRAGKAVANFAGHTAELVAATDATGGQLLIYSVNPLRLNQAYPVGDTPWAVAVDPETSLVWVSFTATNMVKAFDISSGTPVQVHEVPTVDKPLYLDIAPSGDVVVASASGAGIHMFTPPALKR